MADVLNQIVEKVKESNNILVTVSANPSVDELSAALGITTSPQRQPADTLSLVECSVHLEDEKE